ncbi:MAG: 4Fe-4S binding protein [Longimicrobiales bacterium]
MTDEVFRRLARHLDELPGGFPATESGVELRILRRLFTPEEAGLALHLTLLAEPARVVAHRAGMESETAEARLYAMSRKGLIYRLYKGEEPHYMAAQFVIGIWEFHVNDLDPDLIRDVNEYLPHLMDPDTWKRAPQLRTIPVHVEVPVSHDILPHEEAKALVQGRRRYAVAPCICRKEHQLVGEGCDRPLETCLVFDRAADYYMENGIGREIDLDETLRILRQADEAGLVLQPSGAQKISNICCCCGDCCQVLLAFKRHPEPASLVSSPFLVAYEPDLCSLCGTCVDRCQMSALDLAEEDDEVSVDLTKCIGCGLCVTTCPDGALTLERKPPDQQPRVPVSQARAYLKLARERGKMGMGDVTLMALRSARDRFSSR